MADFAKTITNNMTMYGPRPMEKWDISFNWGDNWNYGTEGAPLVVGKFLSLTVPFQIIVNRICDFRRILSTSIPFFGDMSSERVYDGIYCRLFNGSVKDGEERMVGSYTQVSPSTTVFTVTSDPTTTWVEQ